VAYGPGGGSGGPAGGRPGAGRLAIAAGNAAPPNDACGGGPCPSVTTRGHGRGRSPLAAKRCREWMSDSRKGLSKRSDLIVAKPGGTNALRWTLAGTGAAPAPAAAGGFRAVH